MRYPNLIVALSLICLPTLTSCSGDDGAEGNGETETETGTGGEAEAEGDGDGDTGDGDGEPGDGDGEPGDGDGEPGDGDGEPGDGDGEPGDGDGEPGDGDGDPGECVPADDSACSICGAENCCAEIQACDASTDCSCITTCLGEGMNPQECTMMCGVNPNMVPELMALRACSLMFCMEACA